MYNNGTAPMSGVPLPLSQPIWHCSSAEVYQKDNAGAGEGLTWEEMKEEKGIFCCCVFLEWADCYLKTAIFCFWYVTSCVEKLDSTSAPDNLSQKVRGKDLFISPHIENNIQHGCEELSVWNRNTNSYYVM